MLYLIFITQLILLVIVWSLSLELDCIHKLLREGGLSPKEEKAVKRATQELDAEGKGVQKALDDAPK